MRVITGIFAVLALMLTGCSSSATPTTLPDQTPGEAVVSQSASPTTAMPAKPSASPVDEALQFVDQYLETANLALTDRSALTEWRSIFSDSCAVCLSGFEAASAIVREDQSIEGGQLRDWTATKEAATSAQVSVLVTGDIDAAVVRNQAGSTVSQYDPVDSATVLYTMRVQPDGSWLMVAGELVG